MNGRQIVLGALGVALAMTVTACSSSTGPHTQSVPPASSDSSTSSSPDPTTSSSSPTDPTSSVSPGKPTAKPVSTPTVTPAGQGAVNAYVSMTNVVNRWALNPPASLATQLRPFVSTTVLKEITGEYSLLASKHLAYRGSPDTPHLKVVSATSSATVLSDCSIASASDPFVQYDVKTGKSVKTPAGGPYLKAITVLRSNGQWRVNSIVPNTAKTCHA